MRDASNLFEIMHYLFLKYFRLTKEYIFELAFTANIVAQDQNFTGQNYISFSQSVVPLYFLAITKINPILRGQPHNY